MGQAVLRVGDLPQAPLDAAATFHAAWLPQARAAMAASDSLVIVFPPADHAHRGWRLAVVQELAREAAPARVNAVVGAGETAVAETLAWLATAAGITGQVLAVDGNAGKKD